MLTQYTPAKRKQQRKVLENLLQNLDALEDGYLCGNHLTIYFRDAGDEESGPNCQYMKSAMIRELLQLIQELKRVRGHEKRTPL